jgi:glycosyltransferase involved in cell wall biosynthesis
LISVLHCPEQVGNNPIVLSKFEKELGLYSICVSENDNPYTSSAEHVLQRENSPLWLNEFYRLLLIFKASKWSGVVHLNNGRFITPFFGSGAHPKELAFRKSIRTLIRLYAKVLLSTEKSLCRIRSSRKAVFVTFQGSDARESKCFLKKFQDNGLADTVISRSGKSNDSIRSKKKLLAGVADKIYSLNPDLLEVLPRGSEFLPYATEATIHAKILPFNNRKEFVIGHAPTHRIVKGTDVVIEVVSKLRAQGHMVRLELIEGLPREEALKKYEEIDLFIDQLVIGWYGVVSLEVLALGKPVICFTKGKGLQFVDPDMLKDLPIVNADTITLEKRIIEIMRMDITQRSKLAELGISFLKKWHDPRKIAKKLLKDYKVVLSGRNIKCI